MTVNLVRAADLELLSMLLYKALFFKVKYVTPSQKRLLGWYNQAAKRSVCIRTINYMLRRLEDTGLLSRTRRTKDNGAYGFTFDTTLYEFTRLGLSRLKRLGIQAFAIMKEICLEPRTRKKRARPGQPGRAHLGAFAPIAAIAQEVIKIIKIF